MEWREYIVKIQDDGTIIADDIPEGPLELVRCRECIFRGAPACPCPPQAWDERFYCRDGRRKEEQ